jgi:hypothetical protein
MEDRPALFPYEKRILEVRACVASVNQIEANIQEKLQPDEAREDFSIAMSGEPPNAEEKQNAKQCLIAVEDCQGRTAENGENQRGGTKQAVPKPGRRSRKLRALGDGWEDEDKAQDAGHGALPID